MGVALSGLASGMNTQNIINGLMDIERVPYKKLKLKKVQLQTTKVFLIALI